MADERFSDRHQLIADALRRELQAQGRSSGVDITALAIAVDKILDPIKPALSKESLPPDKLNSQNDV